MTFNVTHDWAGWDCTWSWYFSLNFTNHRTVTYFSLLEGDHLEIDNLFHFSVPRINPVVCNRQKAQKNDNPEKFLQTTIPEENHTLSFDLYIVSPLKG